MKKKIFIVIICILAVVYIFTNLIYSKDFTFIIVNNTDEIVDSIKFTANNDQSEDISVFSIAPKSKTKLSKKFVHSGETLLAMTPYSQDKDFVFPLMYLYTKGDIVVVKLYIDEVENGKIKKLTGKSFSNFESGNFFIPWWIRVHFCGSKYEIDVESESLKNTRYIAITRGGV